MMKYKKVLVVVVTYNASKWVNRCFNSLLHSNYPVDVMAIDNLSTDDTLLLLKKFPCIHVVESKENLGFGMANNIGLEFAIRNNYDYIYLLNQDAWINSDTIATLISLFEKYPNYGIISPTQVSESGKIDRGFLGQILKDSNLALIISALFNKTNVDVIPLIKFPAAHWMLSIECVKKVGLFSPVFFHYGEDGNYLRRVHFHGYDSGFSPATMCVHDREFREGGDLGDFMYFHYLQLRQEASDINNNIFKAFLFILIYSMILPIYYIVININHLIDSRSKKHYRKVVAPWIIWKYYCCHKKIYISSNN